MRGGNCCFFFSSRRRHTRLQGDWSSDVCSSDLGPAVRYSQDSVREFEVITTGYEAEFGRAQGGVANIVTRSGGNQWQGSAFTFARDDALDRSNVPGQKPPKLERYQWGGTLSGPLKRDKAYVLGSFEVLDETRGV